jgi:hypothetical protein
MGAWAIVTANLTKSQAMQASRRDALGVCWALFRNAGQGRAEGGDRPRPGTAQDDPKRTILFVEDVRESLN